MSPDGRGHDSGCFGDDEWSRRQTILEACAHGRSGRLGSFLVPPTDTQKYMCILDSLLTSTT